MFNIISDTDRHRGPFISCSTLHRIMNNHSKTLAKGEKMEVVKVALEASELFGLMEVAYRKGVLDKNSRIMGEAIGIALANNGKTIQDLMNNLDNIEEKSLARANRLLEKAGPFIRLASNEKLMEVMSRLLDLAPVRKAMVGRQVRSIERMMAGGSSGGTHPSAGISGLLAGLKKKIPLTSKKKIGLEQ
jgi:hypothetical protein